MSNVRLAIRVRPFTDKWVDLVIESRSTLSKFDISIYCEWDENKKKLVVIFVIRFRELKSEKERVRVVNVLDSKTVTITNLKVCLLCRALLLTFIYLRKLRDHLIVVGQCGSRSLTAPGTQSICYLPFIAIFAYTGNMFA